jgi:hypothetical protein
VGQPAACICRPTLFDLLFPLGRPTAIYSSIPTSYGGFGIILPRMWGSKFHIFHGRSDYRRNATGSRW